MRSDDLAIRPRLGAYEDRGYERWLQKRTKFTTLAPGTKKKRKARGRLRKRLALKSQRKNRR